MGELRKILIIDDERDFCELLKENLESLDEFEVVFETDPEKVEAVIAQELPDVLLIDNIMPARNGSEIVRWLRKQDQFKKLPIIMISGRGEMVFQKKTETFKWEANRPVVKNRGQISGSKNPDKLAEEYGVDCYIAKPVTTEIILAVISDLLKQRGPANAGQESGTS